MTDEELEQKLQEVSEGMAKLDKSDKPLTEEEQKHRARLLRRKEVLSRIKEAKERKQKDAELYHTTMYDLLVNWGEKRPWLMFLVTMMMRAKWSSGVFQKF